MNKVLFLLIASAHGLSGLFTANPALSTVSVSPVRQQVLENGNVVIDCRDSLGGQVHWGRGYHLPYPRLTERRGRLSIFGIKRREGGEYICFNSKRTAGTIAYVDVIPKRNISSVTTASYSSSQFIPLVTRGLPTTSSPLLKRTEVARTPYPCIYGICNGTCCRKDTIESFFDCENGQKINKSLVCNRVNDCDDGSDESKCSPWPSKITVLPKHIVEVYCGDEEKEKSGTLILECESAGHPMPLIRWKKYDGHVPSKCTQYSKRGHGTLTCPDFQQSDQGAYSCVADNSVKSAESQPKSIAKCSNTIDCAGFRVINDEKIEHCLECYCSGKSTQCQNLKSNLTINKISFPDSPTEIFSKENGEIVFLPTKNVLTPDDKVRESAQELKYCTLTKTDFNETSFLKSFGRSLIIPRYKGKTDFMAKAPDLIIRGNGLSLMYTANLISLPKSNMMDLPVKLWPGNWHHLNKEAATRKDLMRVLSDVDTLFIRCEYKQGETVNWRENATIFLESSVITHFPDSVSYVEKCNCPLGYDGLSCESCAAGYIKKSQGNSFVCEKKYIPPPCKEGYKGVNCSECDTVKGYYKKGNVCEKPVCHPDGSISLFPNISGKCNCREFVTGNYCDKCQSNFFYLHKAKGCLKCWCSGVTNQCNSSNLRRTMISNIPRGGYNSSDGRNFWLLPNDFSGNRLTSYGGYLNYTMKFTPNIPKENTYLTVEFLSMDDVTLVFTHDTIDISPDKNEKFWIVPLDEKHWKNSDKAAVTRSEFLTVLSKIKAIYIESPYHLSSGLANLTSARMSSAAGYGGDVSDLALEVEQCSCPKGYTGLSCESCSEGYYRKRNGTITQCIKCNCSYCDPEFGCPDCPQLTYRDNPEEEKMPVCKPCPCNNNGVSCVKDDHNQIFCRCKSGFTGMHCETVIPKKTYDLTVTISPRKIKGKKVGERVNFNCSVYSGEKMVLSAKKKFTGTMQGLMKSTSDDRGTETNLGSKISKNFEVVLENGLEAIECFVHDGQGKLAGHVVAVVDDLVTVVKPVEITNCYTDKIDVKESESKDIICEATGSPTPMVNWYKTRKGSTAEKVDTSEGVHSIETASLSDNGTLYICIAENAEGDKATCSKVLIVRKKCEVINIFPKQIRAAEGKNISIECKTTAKNPVTWSILDPHYKKENPISSPKISLKDGLLRITNASVSDSGIYICTAKGENGKINKTIAVIIEEKRVPPVVSVLEDDKILKIGESFEANCVATGKPVPTVSWSKVNGSFESNVITLGNKLKISNATIKNSGIYKCEAKSSAGNGSSFISVEVEAFFPPKINISEDNVKAHAGEEVTIACLAIGYPRPELKWFAPNLTLTNNSRKINDMILMEPYSSIKEEVTFKVTKDMDGLIINCFAENKYGEDKAESRIKVLQSKGGINETVEFVPIGSYFELNCDYPGVTKWDKLGGGIVGDECPIPNGLMINSVQNQHNGTYICTGNSDFKKIINLIVVGFVPKFNSAMKSYLVLPVHLKSSHEIRIESSFYSSSGSGLFLQKENDKLEIYLEKGKIHLIIYSSEGDLLDIAMTKSIHLNRWYSLAVSIDRNYVDVTVYDDKSLIYERKTERSKDFNFTMGIDRDNFFVGGPVTKARHFRRMFHRRYSYFDGCISRLNINHHEFDIIKKGSFSHNVTLCRRCSEEYDLCPGEAKCLDAPTQYGFICVCPEDYESKEAKCPPSCAGKGCETQLDLCKLLNPCNGGYSHTCSNNMYSLQCQCAYGYSGTTCEKVQEYSFCSRENGYVRLPANLLKRYLGVPEIIKMSFTLHKLEGQLLWQGNRDNYLSISVRDGKLGYTYCNQHTSLEIHSASKLEINKKYVASFRRINNTATLDFNGFTQTQAAPERYRNSTSRVSTNRVVGDIYLGNVPNNTNTFHTGRHVGLSGCIHYIAFGDKPKVNLPEKQLERFNVFLPQKLNQDSYFESDELDYNNAIYQDYN